MPKRYADCILQILGEEPGIKRASVYDRMVYKLELDYENLPQDFPAKKRIETKVTNFRRGGHKPNNGGLRKRQKTR